MVDPVVDRADIASALHDAVEYARTDDSGNPAIYIPELAHADLAATSAGMTLMDGRRLLAGDDQTLGRTPLRNHTAGQLACPPVRAAHGVNAKGGSVRGHRVLRHLATHLGWPFASLGRDVVGCSALFLRFQIQRAKRR